MDKYLFCIFLCTLFLVGCNKMESGNQLRLM